jgi:hypothetical protein
MKLEGSYKGIPIYSSPDCPPDQLYLVNNDLFERRLPKRKDGRPDMRYKVNKLERAFFEASTL